jgi:hypothetical protein
MKKLILLSILFFSINSNSQTVLEVLKALSGKTDDVPVVQKVVFKEVMNEVVIINSTSNEMFSGGDSRKAMPVKLPPGTVKWYYRITPMDVRTNYYYQPRETFFSLLSNNYPLFVNNKAQKGLDFYIINDYAESDFYAKRSFNRYSKFTREKVLGFYGECNLIYNNLMICLNNPNVRDGLKVIVEVVAFGNFN